MTDISIVEITGAVWGEFVLSGSGVSRVGRYCTADLADSSQIGTNYPIPVPGAGEGWNNTDYNYSYWKTHFLKVTSFTDTEIRNVRWYTDGSSGWGTGVTLFIAKSGNLSSVGWGLPSSQYSQATGTKGTTGNPFWSNLGHPYYSVAANCSANAFNYTSANPFWVMSGTAANQKITSAGYSWGVVTQVQVGTNATHGVKPSETFTWKYDII